MSQAVHVPNELYHSLSQYASAHDKTVEEALATLLRAALSERSAARLPAIGGDTTPETEVDQTPISNGPWEGLFGAFESPYPDLVTRHDYYIGNEALTIHRDENGDADDTQR